MFRQNSCHQKNTPLIRDQIRRNDRSFPQQSQFELSWHFSQRQNALYDALDPDAINQACRGFSAFGSMSKYEQEHESDSSSKKGLELIQYAFKVFNHPILVDAVHEKVLYGNAKKKIPWSKAKDRVGRIEDYIRQRVIKEYYHDDVTAFINDSGKLMAFMENMRSMLQDPNAKYLIISNSVPTIAMLSLLIKILYKEAISPLIIHGETDRIRRVQVQNLFNTCSATRNPQNRVAIISTGAAGLGIELHSSHVCLFDLSWNPSVDKQALARTYRDGNPYPLIKMYHLSGDNPFAKKLQNIQEDKLQWSKILDEFDMRWFIDRFKGYLKLTEVLQMKEEELNTVFEAVTRLCLAEESAMEICSDEQRVADLGQGVVLVQKSEAEDSSNPHGKRLLTLTANDEQGRALKRFRSLSPSDSQSSSYEEKSLKWHVTTLFSFQYDSQEESTDETSYDEADYPMDIVEFKV